MSKRNYPFASSGKRLSECDREELIERLMRSGDRASALSTQINALQKKVAKERSGRRQANRERDKVVSELKKVRSALSVIADVGESGGVL